MVDALCLRPHPLPPRGRTHHSSIGTARFCGRCSLTSELGNRSCGYDAARASTLRRLRDRQRSRLPGRPGALAQRHRPADAGRARARSRSATCSPRRWCPHSSRAGVPAETLERAVADGFLSFQRTDEYLPYQPGPLSTRTFAEFQASAGPGAELLPAVFEVLGLPKPDPASPIHVDEEALFERFLEVWRRLPTRTRRSAPPIAGAGSARGDARVGGSRGRADRGAGATAPVPRRARGVPGRRPRRVHAGDEPGPGDVHVAQRPLPRASQRERDRRRLRAVPRVPRARATTRPGSAARDRVRGSVGLHTPHPRCRRRVCRVRGVVAPAPRGRHGDPSRRTAREAAGRRSDAPPERRHGRRGGRTRPRRDDERRGSALVTRRGAHRTRDRARPRRLRTDREPGVADRGRGEPRRGPRERSGGGGSRRRSVRVRTDPGSAPSRASRSRSPSSASHKDGA